MVLRRLAETGATAPVQNTTLSIDAVGRYVCSTWDEATNNGGPPFTVVIVGSGMYGGYLATKLLERQPDARILVLEAGPYLVSEHVQNLGPIGLNVASPIAPESDPGVARELVWGLPWRGNTEFPGLAYCCGGKSLYWGGWCPRLTPEDLAHWPADVAAYLQAHYLEVESEIGVVPATDFISGDLLDAVWARAQAVAPLVPGLDQGLAGGPIEPAPIAVQGSAPVSGLFSFDKFSCMPLLTAAIRDDANRSGGNDAARRIFLVPRAHVIRATVHGGAATSLDLTVDGTHRTLEIDDGCAVVLAASTIESTRLALSSCPSALIGRNLMAHVRSDFTARIRASALAVAPGPVRTAALLARGAAPTGRFHLQLTASTSRGGSDAMLYQMIPDLDVLTAQLANTDPDWVTVTLRGIGEMHPDPETPVPNAAGSWVDLSPFETDENDAARAYVHLQLRPGDADTWAAMDQVAVAFLEALAGGSADIEYLYDGGWQSAPFPLDRPFPAWHWGLGTTYHEAGTMWLGENSASSVAAPDGRLHHVSNIYVGDQAAFPTVGSVNPVLTGLTLARRLAETLADR